jgi:site-specific recombinase XerD
VSANTLSAYQADLRLLARWAADRRGAALV